MTSISEQKLGNAIHQTGTNILNVSSKYVSYWEKPASVGLNIDK